MCLIGQKLMQVRLDISCEASAYIEYQALFAFSRNFFGYIFQCAACQLPVGRPMMWMMPLHLHVNKKFGVDVADDSTANERCCFKN